MGQKVSESNLSRSPGIPRMLRSRVWLTPTTIFSKRKSEMHMSCRVRGFALMSLLVVASAAGNYVSVDGGRLYYEECGSGPAVVLLHDGLLHSVLWDDMWPGLCSKYHVMRYDRRGYGRSDAAKAPFSPERDLLVLMQQTKIDRAILVGCSSGTALALDFAIAHPERVAALFLIGPVVHGMRSSDYFLQRGNALSVNDPTAAAENWSKDRFQVAGERPEARKKIFDALVMNPQNLKVPGQFEVRPSPPTVTRLSEVQAPTLVIVGESDIADVHAFAGAIQAAVPVVRREVWKDDGHLIPLEKPAELIARLDGFAAVTERKTVHVPLSTLKQYAGMYSLGASPAKIVVRNRRLVLQIGGDVEVPLFAASDSLFFVRTTGTEVEFERSAGRKARAMIVRSPGAAAIRCPRL
jgi:3-oxoadipate enol-lactonase